MKILVACEISIHAPRAGSDVADDLLGAAFVKFQSTLPVRGATSEKCLIIS